jgi:type IV secretory pathway VirB9-like protein
MIQTILLKPLVSLPSLKTNVQFGTNRRAYNIDVIYGTRTTRNLQFWYPGDIVKQLNASAQQRRAHEKTIVARGLQVDLKHIYTNYQVVCNGARFCPTFVGSDHARTFILLPPGLESLGIPTVMIQRSGENQIPNVNFQGLPWVTVDGVFDVAQIRYGMDKAQPVVEITRR